MSSSLREGIIYSGKSFNSANLKGAGTLSALDVVWNNYRGLQISTGTSQTATSVDDSVSNKMYYSFSNIFSIKDNESGTGTKGLSIDLTKYFRLESSTTGITYTIGAGQDYSGNGLNGIYFEDSTIQSDAFTLKSLVDRIVQLESTVTELQSQLAAKANTANPAFTGKVSISNQ